MIGTYLWRSLLCSCSVCHKIACKCLLRHGFNRFKLLLIRFQCHWTSLFHQSFFLTAARWTILLGGILLSWRWALTFGDVSLEHIFAVIVCVAIITFEWPIRVKEKQNLRSRIITTKMIIVSTLQVEENCCTFCRTNSNKIKAPEQTDFKFRDRVHRKVAQSIPRSFACGLTYFSPKWRRSWSRMFPFVRKLLPQFCGQVKGLSSLWILIWIFRFCFSLKAFPQFGKVHLKG